MRPWSARAAVTLVVTGLLVASGLPAATAKSWKSHVPAGQSPAQAVPPWKGNRHHRPWKTPKPWKPYKRRHGQGQQAQLPEIPKLDAQKLPKISVPKVELPKVSLPSPASLAPSVTTAPSSPSKPAPVSTSPSPGSTSPGGKGAVGRRAPRAASPTRTAGTPRSATAQVRGAAGKRSTRARARRASPAARRQSPRPGARGAKPGSGSGVTSTVRDIVEVVPTSVTTALAALAALSVVLGGGYVFTVSRARRLDLQRGDLLQEVGLLQSALLPPVPDTLGSVRPSVAYRPADGPAAGGDFYDALDLSDGRAGFILGDVSGHGREALERTAFARYTLRAFLEAGLEPRLALQVAARVVGEHLGGEFVTVLLAVHDPADGSLTWASAGHPAPIVLGTEFAPVTAGSSPPIGMGLESGFRQTTVPLPTGALACMFTDGLVEARTDRGFMGRSGLIEILEELGEDATATALIEMVAAKTHGAPDDMAACLIAPDGHSPVTAVRLEELVVFPAHLEGDLPDQFLAACGVPAEHVATALAEAHEIANLCGGAVLTVRFAGRRTVQVLPRESRVEEGVEAASRRLVAH